jgi:NodT family efflux transporter outer membrane factor (OMF) lipoprotein
MREIVGIKGKTLFLSAPSQVAATAILVGMLSGCEVGPDYDGPPDVKIEAFHNAPVVIPDTAGVTAPNLDKWWTGFNDPQLTKIVEKALEQNLDLDASLARVQQARAVAQSAGAKLLPTVDASGQALRVRQSLQSPIGAIGSHLPGYDRDASLYDVGAGASWEIDLFGGLRRQQESAEAAAEAAAAGRLGTCISVAADAADSYFQIRGYQSQIEAIQKQIETNRQLLDLMKLRQTYGVATDLDVNQTEALLRSSEAVLPQLHIGLEAQMNRLDVLQGVQPGTYAAELSTPSPIPSLPSVTTMLPASDLLRRRPDIIAAERQLAASRATIGVALSDYYPKISLSGLLGFESADVGHLFKAATFQPQAIGGLRWRLFDFGKVDAEVAQAKGVYAEALAQYRQSILRATEDVENSFMAMAQYKIQTDVLTQKESALTRALNAVQADHEHGSVSLAEVLEAERGVLSARYELASAKTASARAAVASFRALGGGW